MTKIRKTNMQFTIILALLQIFNLTAVLANEARFPTNPNLTETPGELCSTPDAVRYPEKIAYCERDVDAYTKKAVIQKYDRVLGYKISTMNRGEFKIDHLIPLCAGGANSESNLWPQHKSVYNKTDPVEPLLCQKMQEGKLRQTDAVRIIIEAKTNLKKIPEIISKLNQL